MCIRDSIYSGDMGRNCARRGAELLLLSERLVSVRDAARARFRAVSLGFDRARRSRWNPPLGQGADRMVDRDERVGRLVLERGLSHGQLTQRGAASRAGRPKTGTSVVRLVRATRMPLNQVLTHN